jgi:creatinine amidohydrolase
VNGSRVYEHQTWKEIAEAVERGAAVAVPVGAIEQHGYHLPLDTDAFFARELCLAGSDGFDVIVGPLLPFGYRSRPLSGGGPTFPGTLSLSGGTFTALVREVLESLIGMGFRKLLVYSWHMENQNFVYEAAYLAAEGRDDLKVVVLETPFDGLSDTAMATMYGDEFPGWPAEHASLMETSVMLHMRPELVDMERAVDDGAEREPSYEIIPPPASVTTESGALWKPTRGTADKGKVALEEIAEHLQRVLREEFPELALA